MAYTASQRERWKAEAAENISNDAQRYFMMVWNPDATSNLPPGPRLLRAVFTLHEPNLQMSLTRARVIPMTALSLSFAEKMRKMIDVSDVESQFVCWATIENEFERVVDHSMFIVDIHASSGGGGGEASHAGGLVWEGAFHSPDDVNSSHTGVLPVQPQQQQQGPLSPSGSPHHANSRQPSHSRQEKRQAPAAAADESNHHPPTLTHSNLEALSPDNIPSSQNAQVKAPAAVPIVARPPGQSIPHGMPATAAALWGIAPQQQQQQLQNQQNSLGGIQSEQVSEVMEIALLTSRAAAKIVASVSESQARIDHLIEQTMPLTQQHLPMHQLTQIVHLLAQMETRLKLIEEQQMLTLEGPPRPPMRSAATQCSTEQPRAVVRSVAAQTEDVVVTSNLDVDDDDDDDDGDWNEQEEPIRRQEELAAARRVANQQVQQQQRVSNPALSAVSSSRSEGARTTSSPRGNSSERQQQNSPTSPGADAHGASSDSRSRGGPSYLRGVNIVRAPADEVSDEPAAAARQRVAAYRSSRPQVPPSISSPTAEGLQPAPGIAVTLPAKNDPVVSGPAALSSKFRVRKAPSTSNIAGPTYPVK